MGNMNATVRELRVKEVFTDKEAQNPPRTVDYN